MDLENNWPIALAFILYLVLMMSIGLYYSRRQKNLSSYILGDRQLGPWLTSMSAEASDMSGWMLMGLPGYAYLHGLSAFWTGIGLIVGTWANWVLVSQRLRNYTEVADNSLTIPDYLSNRFEDRKNGLRLICALFIILFFIIYTWKRIDYKIWSFKLNRGVCWTDRITGAENCIVWSQWKCNGTTSPF